MAKASISIYFAIILISILSFFAVLFESARIKSMEAAAYHMTYMATDSTFGEYAFQLWEEYDLLTLWKSKSVINGDVATYIENSLNAGENLNVPSINFRQLELLDLSTETTSLVDRNGYYFFDQIIPAVQDDLKESAIDFLIEYVGLEEEVAFANRLLEQAKQVVDQLESLSSEGMRIFEGVSLTVEQLSNPKELFLEVKSILQIQWDHMSETMVQTLIDEVLMQNEEVKEGIQALEREVKEYLKEYERIKKEFELIQEVDETTLISYEEMKRVLLEDATFKKMMDLQQMLETYQWVLTKGEALNQQENIGKEDGEEWVSRYGEIISFIDSLSEKENMDGETEDTGWDLIKNIAKQGLLSLVLGDVSTENKAMPKENLPSLAINDQEFEYDIVMSGWTSLYGSTHFSNYVERKQDHFFSCEQEYMLGGDEREQNNLYEALKQLYGLRVGFDVFHLLSDASKMKEMEGMAASMPIVVATPSLLPVVKLSLIVAWANAEATADLQILLQGGKVPLVKTAETWYCDLNELLTFDHKKIPQEWIKNSTGFDYTNYITILISKLPKEVVGFRMMDLIQVNVKENINSDFLMKDCINHVEIDCFFKGKRLFFDSNRSKGYLLHSTSVYAY